MRDYQARKTKYILPRTVYHQTVWRIRDYYRMKERAEETQEPEKRRRYQEWVEKVDDALQRLPEEYRRAVWENIQHGQAFPLDADRSTYGRYKSKFIFFVAERFDLI